MIYYSKQYWGLVQLMRFYGSAIPRAMPFALASAGLTLAYEFLSEQHTVSGWFSEFPVPVGRDPTPYPFQVFGFVVGFILVFR